MTKLATRFDQFDRDYLKFDLVEPKLASRPDLHAFILLNKLCPDSSDMIAAAEHDKIWLEIDLERLQRMATDDQILELVRCGVMYDDDLDSLALFV